MKLTEIIQEKVRTALASMVAEPEKYATVKPTRDAKHGDYQVDCAMALAKVLGKNPRDIAQEIAGRIPRDGLLAEPEIAGPGFINLRLTNDWMATQLSTMATDERLGAGPAAPPRKFVVDFSSPNVAKPMHVGHLRSTIIGDALTRLLRFLGHTVITDNHLGDWGTQFGMLIYGYRHFLNEAAYRADPVRELARLYVEVRNQIDREVSDLEIARHVFSEDDLEVHNSPTSVQCQLETAKLHSGDADNLALWHEFMPHCLEAVHRIYRRLGVLPFDYEHGESFYNPMLSDVVTDMLARGIAFESQGAVVIPNAKGNIPR